ncbi:MAG: DUF433 domain-containing protein [Cryobacterium sp.]|nr:DUF433 domain-containing protein [Cryobacterium sp.]
MRGQAYRRKHDTGFFQPVIRRLDDGRLTFNNLIEVHNLRALRVKHEIRLDHVRGAIEIAGKAYGISRLLISKELLFDAGGLFLERYGQLLELSPSQQIAIKGVLIDYLSRIDYDSDGLPTGFFPIERTISNSGKKLILVSPVISFGRPVVQRVGVSTHIIADRLNAGESEESVMKDYGIDAAELKEAAAYEAAA